MRLAALALLFAATLAAGDNSEHYRGQLKNLDSANAQSTCTARALLRDWMPKSDVADRAGMFRSFRAFYLDAVQSSAASFAAAMQPFVREIMDWLEKGQSFETARRQMERRPDIRRAAAPWFDCGFTFSAAEGDLYPAQDSATLLEFVPRLPPTLASYIRFRAREDAQEVGGDAALALSWEQLRQRLLRWESFARGHPQLPETSAEIQPAIRGLAESYFFGEDNTPTFDGQTGRIAPALVASWKHLATLDRESRYASLAAALLASLDGHHGQFAKDDRALFARFGLADGFDDWWRRYSTRN